MSVNLDILSALEREGGRIQRSATADASLTFPQALALVDGAVTALTAAKRGPGDRIGIQCTQGFDWLIWDLACQAIGAVSVPVAPAQPHRLDRIECDAFVVGETPAMVVVPPGVQLLDATAYRTHGRRVRRRHAFALADPVTVKFTSGTVAQPKGYSAACGHVEHMVRGIQTLFRLDADDRLLVAMPMNVFLQRTLAYTAILAGAHLAFCEPKNTLRAAKRFRPTLVMGPPHLFKTVYDLYRHQQALGTRLPFGELWGGHVRCLWTGSAPSSPELLGFYEAQGLPLYEGYGTTETGMIAKNCPEAYRRGTVGKLFPGVEVLLSPESEILVRSPYQPAKGMCGGWHATGDTGVLDKDGYLRLCGRLDDQIVLTNGKKLAPTALESALEGCPAVRRACIVGERRPYPVALIETGGGPTAARKANAAVAALNHRLDEPCRVRGVRFLPVDEFARRGCVTELGKLKRRQVPEAFAADIEALYQQRIGVHVA